MYVLKNLKTYIRFLEFPKRHLPILSYVLVIINYAVKPLTKTQELGLAKKAAGGDKQARETLIRANIRYAFSYAKLFYGRGLSNDDIDTEAVIGLIKAVDHFDYTKNCKLITFARMYIMNEIVSSRNKCGYLPRQSVERLRMILKINKAMKEIDDADCSHKELVTMISAKTGLAKSLIKELFEENLPCVSLDAKISDGSEDSRLSIISDNASCSPEETAVYHIQKQELYENLDKLKPLEKQIICMFFGLQEYKKPYSLSEIGEKLNASKQYVFYIKKCALDKLKRKMCGIAA